ncbi:DNA-processing protein DprA [Nitratireductor sp. PBL-C9]|uniref:DNA-processing protein DprA n=1 Tax=Nitratireductor sp. PBL-C9 TaxID=3435013 RepID=UPI003D7E6E9F
MIALSPNTQAILLLTAPLIVGRNSANSDLLGAGEYKRLARCLREIEREPADLLVSNPIEILEACKAAVDSERLRRLMGRGFQLSQAVERWQTRAIWVLSRADADYPRRLKMRLREDAPAVLYGCGEVRLLDEGGLAVVGSRHVDETLIDYTMTVGHLAASSGKSIVSGGARGIDQAAMRGALEAGGQACGVLADSLEKQAMNREHRSMLLEGRLTLVSPYDPNAGFNVGNAMQRNKLIYALADAALVVSSDVNKGGTWAGAVEQLEKLKFVQVYVRSGDVLSSGLAELRRKGALAWPQPDTPQALEEVLSAPMAGPSQGSLDFHPDERAEDTTQAALPPDIPHPMVLETSEKNTEAPSIASVGAAEHDGNPADLLFSAVRKSIERLGNTPMVEAQVADALQIERIQAKVWLKRLVEEGVLEKKNKPVRYVLRRDRLL